MSEGDKVFAGSIPANYDRYLVPLIFQGYAEDMAKRVAARSPRAVLETAAGSGVVARAMAAALPRDVACVATDLNQPMLDYARSRQAGDMRFSWQPADAQSLPFEDRSFDAVCCQFGAMFFPDRIKAYGEARRVLRPRGVFVFNVWDRIEENVLAGEVTDALAELYPGDPPRFLARTPHGYHDVALIRSELEQAGLSVESIETKAGESRAPSPRHPALGYCQGTPLRNEIETRGGHTLEAATDHAARKIASRHGDGEVAAKIQAHVITAIA
ncbi:MAG: methyltransferase domain-containing protein [Bradyrhizobium sp.]|uniref:class I SAM-dependent methyltransferase n=1 Tax=Bradyrhizobium sp. TaxID=376 RepID=UPI0025BA63AD|nr:methyltransferase domain-containing protein [Bradyrhizobium sp.]MBI5260292.1 methyltransferase domain-containing protein [Bradyrhizobium sp.]